MRNPQIANIASIALLGLLSSQAFAWSIDGVVKSKISGRLLGGVKISTFNFGGYETTSAEDGTFRLSSDGINALMDVKASNIALHMEGNTLTIYNADARSLSVSVINSLGKVLKKNNIENVQGIVSLDLGKPAQGAKFIRVSADNRNSTFMVTDKGIVKALKKEGEVLPSLQFSLDGYANFVYQMQAETETGVTIEMARPSSSSSSDNNPTVSSSSEKQVVSSSSKTPNDTPVDCSGKTAKAGKQNMSVTVDGKERTFIMYIPDSYKGDKPVPLFVDYHPVMGSGEGQYNGTTYRTLTAEEGVISLYPDGTKSADSRKMGPGWNVGPCCSDDDDVKFSREMVAAVEEIACIDKKRVYAAGFSMGGGMSNHVACFMSDIYAAVAPAAMDLNTTNSAQCNPTRPISIIMFRGTADNVCKYQGGDSGYGDGLNFLGAEKNFKFWAEKNGCTGVPSQNSDGCDEYSTCRDGTKVVLCTKQGGGHEQGNGNVGWPFLKQFTLP